MLFCELVNVSTAVAASPGRRDKVEHLRGFLGRAAASEIPIAVHYLSGRLTQGRIGIGASVLATLRQVPAGERASPALADIDRDFARATPLERDFLVRLLAGELRQGALEGLMLEAIAAAAGVAPEDVQRAAMVAGDVGAVAQAALTEGAAGLHALRSRLLQPIRPRLASLGANVSEALARLEEEAPLSTSSTA